MIKLRAKELLEKNGKTKYWLYKQLGMSYQNYNKMIGLMSSLTINKTKIGDDVTITIDNIDNELIFNYYQSYKNFKVVPFSSEHIATQLSNYQNVYDTYKDVVTKLDSNISVKKCYNCE